MYNMSTLIGIYLDPIGSILDDQDNSEEFKTLTTILLDDLKKYDIKIIHFEILEEIESRPVDIFIVDYGGMIIGASGLAEHNYNFLSNIIEERPSMLLILYTVMTDYAYKNFIEDECELSNNVCSVVENGIDGLKQRIIEYIESK